MCFSTSWRAFLLPLAAKTPLGRALLFDEMVPSIVTEDGIVLRVYCRLAEFPSCMCFRKMLKNVFPSGRSWFWPDGKHLNDVSSGERRVWPDGKAFNTVSSTERWVLPDGNALGDYCSQQRHPSDGPSRFFKAVPSFRFAS